MKQIYTLPFIYKLIMGFLLLIGTFMVSMRLGAADTSIKDVWLAVAFATGSETVTMLREIRLPREIASLFVGAALSVSGAMMQGLTRNPLADPGLLGLTAGANAALAVTMAFMLSANYFVIMLACFFGAAFGTAMVLGISAMKRGGLSPLRIVLAGAAVSAFLNAVAEGTGLYFNISKEVSMWTAGGIIGTTWEQLFTIVPFIVFGLLVAFLFSRQLTILSLNEEVAIGLGQKIVYIKYMLIAVIVILAGASVALVGNLAFIGLMIPHMVRPVVGTDYRFILPMSALFGATFMLVADTLARTLNAPFETPVVAIISILGLPFFLMIVRRGGKTWS